MQNRNAFREKLVRRFVRANRIPAVLPPRVPRISACKRRWSGSSLKPLVLQRSSAIRSALRGKTLRENLGQHPQSARDARQMNRTHFHCPNGATENSPAFQRWVNEFESVSSPAGTADLCVVMPMAAHDLSRPYGTLFSNARIPTVETVGYCQSFLRDWNGVNAALLDRGGRGFVARHWRRLVAGSVRRVLSRHLDGRRRALCARSLRRTRMVRAFVTPPLHCKSCRERTLVRGTGLNHFGFQPRCPRRATAYVSRGRISPRTDAALLTHHRCCVVCLDSRDSLPSANIW